MRRIYTAHFLYLNIKLKFVENILFTNFEVYVILELQIILYIIFNYHWYTVLKKRVCFGFLYRW